LPPEEEERDVADGDTHQPRDEGVRHLVRQYRAEEQGGRADGQSDAASIGQGRVHEGELQEEAVGHEDGDQRP
jgi:hypothetical protein